MFLELALKTELSLSARIIWALFPASEAIREFMKKGMKIF
jgi:hypothetical protein